MTQILKAHPHIASEHDVYELVGVEGDGIGKMFSRGQMIELRYDPDKGHLRLQWFNVSCFVRKSRWAEIHLENMEGNLRLAKADLLVIQRILPRCAICDKIGTVASPIIRKHGNVYEHRVECNWDAQTNDG